jgi:hypothetical protein
VVDGDGDLVGEDECCMDEEVQEKVFTFRMLWYLGETSNSDTSTADPQASRPALSFACVLQ